MKTRDLIGLLAGGAELTAAAAPPRAQLPLVLLASLVSIAATLSTLGVRTDLALAAIQPNLWIKLVFCMTLAAAGYLAARRLGVPGARIALLPVPLAAPVLLIWCLAAAALLRADPEQRLPLLLGDTWRCCPVLIALISLPLLAAALHAMRACAPTRLRLAGGAAGLAAGAAAAAIYCLHCPETSAAFVACWYVLGMLAPATVGALIGPRVLAW